MQFKSILRSTAFVLFAVFALFTVAACGGDNSSSTSTGLPIEMVKIPAGTFQMGEEGLATPVHSVTLTGFYMGKYAVTQEQYLAVMGVNPSFFNGVPGVPEGSTRDTGTPPGEVQEKRPVERVTWFDAVEFCNKLSILEGLTPAYAISDIIRHEDGFIIAATVAVNWNANGYRLPTESEWEYACRAGTTTAYSFGDDAAQLGEYAWFSGNSNTDDTTIKSHQVGLKKPNEWGLYDMHGNVWEWVWDWWASYTAEAKTDPRGPGTGTYRVERGGSWHLVARHLRSANRSGNGPSSRFSSLGFRVVRP
jgi:formylglycine-generating enzyme required for sulfatase activity